MTDINIMIKDLRARGMSWTVEAADMLEQLRTPPVASPSAETDELADALFWKDDTWPKRPGHREQLRQLARDAAALGAVKAEAKLARVIAAVEPFQIGDEVTRAIQAAILASDRGHDGRAILHDSSCIQGMTDGIQGPAPCDCGADNQQNRTGEKKMATTETEFDRAVRLERVRAEDKGYVPEHDAEHGLDHLLIWAYKYAKRGEAVKSAGLIAAARDLLAAGDERG